MKNKTVIFIITALIISAGAGAWYFYSARRAKSSLNQYTTAEVSRGVIERVIASTGTLSPVGSVEVGTQVSGTIEKVLVDFNDTVRAGQIIAEIDRSVLLTRLSEVEASLARADALFAQSEQEFKRGEVLFEKGLISEQEFVKYRTDYYTQKASLQVAKAAVATAAENVRYATIRSPVRGTVITRNVDVGQTVAASLSAPTLFVIAEDLRKMQIMALVDETDIGKINAAQEVRFSVQAYPDRNYTGTVSQIRLQPEIVQNVVTYTVVVLAENRDGTLLPGMTANVEFVEAREGDALLAPAAAFRFRPPDDAAKRFENERKEARGEGMGKMMKQIEEAGGVDAFLSRGDLDERVKKRIEEAGGVEAFKKKLAEGKARMGESGGMEGGRGDGRGGEGGRDNSGIRQGGGGEDGRTKQGGQGGREDGRMKQWGGLGGREDGRMRQWGGQGGRDDGRMRQGGGQGKKRQGGGDSGRGTLWTLDDNNELKPVYVRMGINDGAFISVSGGEDLYEGLAVITGATGGGKDKRKPGSKSLLPQM